jgi:pimeloyl-ACP methyl ester carboxylesterase
LTSVAVAILALLFRVACIQVSPDASPQRRPHTAFDLLQVLLSGFWLGLAAWIAGAMLQGWVPIWQMLLVGTALTATATVIRSRFAFNSQPAVDFIAMASLMPLSVIPTRVELVLGAALVFAVAGFVLDRLIQRMPRRFQRALPVVPAALVVLIGTQITQPGNFGSRLLQEEPFFPLRIALVMPDAGARIALDSGATAWLQETASRQRRGTALVMHGNHRKGSQQPSSIALQGALMRAGYDVLAVDHPGFGESPAPHASAAWHAWDPTLGPKQALRQLNSENRSQARETIVVGHSMGVDVALKFVADGADVDAAYLFAGSLDRPHGPRWLSGFHRERNLSCCVPSPTLDRIRDEYYGGGDRFASALPENHALVHYVRFGIEHADVTESREPLLAAIPPPRKICDFAGVSHYFNTLSMRRFVLIDTRTVQRTADIFNAGERADAVCGRSADAAAQATAESS